jgi:hypothetical protein
MKNQPNLVDRRAQPRFGVIAQLEDITYSTLRKHGVVRGAGRDAVAVKTIKD